AGAVRGARGGARRRRAARLLVQRRGRPAERRAARPRVPRARRRRGAAPRVPGDRRGRAREARGRGVALRRGGDGAMDAIVTRARVLCVDDEANVLAGLSVHLHRRYDVVTATSGAAGLASLAGDPAISIVVSDMRMPGMSGAEFLAEARRLRPDAVRLLLTGHLDLDVAIAAVNDGQVFRFLTKPCPPPTLLAALAAAAEQHRLVTAERVLLEQTLRGAVQTLVDVLSITNPAAFGRATRIKQHASEIAAQLGMEERWQLEVAALLSQLGCITLPADTAE